MSLKVKDKLKRYENIPEEMRSLTQWVCFDILPPLTSEGKPRKVPFIPGTNNEAASNRPSDWRSFRAACKDVKEGKRAHIGFCFASTDPFVFIDLDDPNDKEQVSVFKRIKSYAQYSVSGEGCHIICKGNFVGKGKHPSCPDAGIFNVRRFCLMTADIVKGRSGIKTVPDDDLQAVHTWLGGGKDHVDAELAEYEATLPDQEVFDNGMFRFQKFNDLCNGKWEHFEEYHGDHSTADHAFLAMLCDLTESNEQVRWFFANSGMWNEARAAKKSGHGFHGYVNRTILKIRSSQAREAARMSNHTLCFCDEAEEIPDPIPEITPVKNPQGDMNLIESLPDGLIKDLARYSYQSSYLPLQEASILMAFMFVSALVGRAYLTPTKSGLNMWMILVGGTSCGKDEYQSGIKRILKAMSKNVPHVRKIFGGEIVSGPGIEQVFQDTFRYISYIPEFGDTFKSLANPMAPDYIRTLTRGLLNSYNSAGPSGSSEGRRKAQNSEEKVYIERPCLCLAGEATPESLYGSMTTRELATGFLQRFILMNVPLSSWSMTENAHHGAPPPRKLIARLEELAVLADSADVKGTFTVVDASPEAAALLKKYREDKRKETMECSEGLSKKELINRAGLKAIRAASILAVCADFYAPRIELQHAIWAIECIERTDGDLMSRFDNGEIGSGQAKQEYEVTKAACAVSKMTIAMRRALGMGHKVAKENTMVPMAVLKKIVINTAIFAGDKMGSVSAFDKCIESMVRAGVFVKVTEAYASDKFDHLKGMLLCINQQYLK